MPFCRDAKCARHLSVCNISHILLWKLHFPGSLSSPWLPGRFRQRRALMENWGWKMGEDRIFLSYFLCFRWYHLLYDFNLQWEHLTRVTLSKTDSDPGNYISFCLGVVSASCYTNLQMALSSPLGLLTSSSSLS